MIKQIILAFLSIIFLISFFCNCEDSTTEATEDVCNLLELWEDDRRLVFTRLPILEIDQGAEVEWSADIRGKSYSGHTKRIIRDDQFRIVYYEVIINNKTCLYGSIPPPQTVKQNLSSLFFLDANTGWVVGDSGYVRKTKDAGASWSKQTTDDFSNIYDICFVNESTGIIVAERGIIFKTSNGGNDWHFRGSGISNTYDLVTVDFRTQNNTTSVFAAGTYGAFIKSDDLGETWSTPELNFSGDIKSISSRNSPMLVIVFSDGRIKVESLFSLQFNDITPPTASTLFALKANFSRIYIAGFGGAIFKSIDRGETWTQMQSGTDNNIFSVDYYSSQLGVFTGQFGTIGITEDSGTTWTLKSSGTTNNLNKVFFVDSDIIYAVGDKEIVIKSSDGGNTWQKLSL